MLERAVPDDWRTVCHALDSKIAENGWRVGADVLEQKRRYDSHLLITVDAAAH